jgi:hypothetical protein
MRRLIWALLLAAVLLAGLVGYAVADIPDAHPSAPDPEHTFYGCVYPAVGIGTSALRTFYPLDKSLGNCPSNMTEVRLVPSAVP